MFAINPLEHVLDTSQWHIFPNLHWEVHLPFGLTKYKILLVVAAALVLLIFLPLARRVEEGGPPRGRFWNGFEGLLTFIRDQVANILEGGRDAFMQRKEKYEY